MCEHCSKNKYPVPAVGLLFAVRVCDRCYHNMGTLSMKNSIPAISENLDVDDNNLHLKYTSKRNELVDELATKMPAIVERLH